VNGLFSNAPSPTAIRLVVAGLLFGQVQALILFAAPDGAGSPRSLIIVLGLLMFGSFVGAIVGESGADPKERCRRHRHGS
jgi:hypothetical protein